jgi:hypothetical protein
MQFFLFFCKYVLFTAYHGTENRGFFWFFFLSPSLKTRPLGDDDDDESTRPNEDEDDAENSIAGGKGDDAGLPAALLGHLTPLIPKTIDKFFSVIKLIPNSNHDVLYRRT